MLYLLLTLYSLLLGFLAFKNFRLAVGVFIVSLPSYLIRFNLGPYPSTLLEFSFGILFLVWLIKYAKYDVARITYHVSNNRILTTCYILLATSSFVSIFISDMWYYSLGQWRAYFLEPMVVFIILIGRLNSIDETRNLKLETGEERSRLSSQPEFQVSIFQFLSHHKFPVSSFLSRKKLNVTDIIFFLTLSTISISIVAIIQKFTGAIYPPALWDDELFGRATSFFTSPNAVGLYLGPIILLTVGTIAKKITKSPLVPNFKFLISSFSIVIAAIALFFTKSLGAWAAVVVGLLVFTYLIGYKKTAIAAILAGAILAISVSPYLSITKSQSLSNRLVLWDYSWDYLTTSPKNFIFGAGIRQFFRKVQKPHYDAKELERLIYPHNIFLNFWTEIGLVGMLAFVGMFACLAHIAYRITRNGGRYLGAGLAAALAVILIHGLIDVPYFKNDLAMIFWIIVAIVIARRESAKSADDRRGNPMVFRRNL